MGKAEISQYDVRTGWLPQICPKHGLRANRLVRRKFYWRTPSWAIVLVVLCVLASPAVPAMFWVALVVALVARRGAEFDIPGCDACGGGYRTRVVIRSVVGGVALLVLGAGVVTSSGTLMMLSLPLVLVALLVGSSMLDPVGAVTGKLDGEMLRLKGVHASFSSALRPNPALAYAQAWAPAGGYHPAPAATTHPYEAWPQRPS